MSLNKFMIAIRKGALFGGLLFGGLVLLLAISGHKAAQNNPSNIQALAVDKRFPALEEAMFHDAEYWAFLPVVMNQYSNLPTTQIKVDGLAEDWQGRPILHKDPSGDAEPGFLDLAAGYAFINQHALYFMLEAVDPEAPFVLFDTNLEAGGRSYQITWEPGQNPIPIFDVSSENQEIVGWLDNSPHAFEEVFEVRIDLDDLVSTENLRLTRIAVMVGSDSEWRSADDWTPPIAPPVVTEKDPPRVHSEETPYVLARRYNLPEGYLANRIVEAPGYGQFLSRSQDGTIYIQSTRLDIFPYIALLDVVTGKQQHVLDLRADALPYRIIGGPGDTVFIQVNAEMWQVSPDGSHEIWGYSPDTVAFYYTPDGRLLGAPHYPRSELVEIHKDGSYSVIANGFSEIFAVVGRSDGVIGLFDVGTGNTVRIDPDGSQHILSAGVDPGENRPLFLDLNEALFTGFGEDLVSIDWNTGAITSWPPEYFRPCIWNPSDYLFVDGNRLIMVADQMGWADLASGTNGLIVFRGVDTFAADIGPEGDLYIGTPGCGSEYPGQVVRYSAQGDNQVYVDNLPDGVWDITFDDNGGLYIVTGTSTFENQLFYKGPNNADLIEIPDAPGDAVTSLVFYPDTGYLLATIPGGTPVLAYDISGLVRSYVIEFETEYTNEFRLAYAPDGTLYAYSTPDFHFSQNWIWLLEVDLETGKTKKIFEILRENTGGGIGNIDIDEEGGIWLLISPDSWLYQIMKDETHLHFAQNLPIDTPAVAVNGGTGDIYFTHSSGIYRIYREP